MRLPFRHINFRQTSRVLGLTALLALGGCDHDSQEDVHSLVASWFDIGETLYFDSQITCTAAVFRARTGELKSKVPLMGSVDEIFARVTPLDLFALTVAETSANQLFLDIMNTDRPTGVAIQAVSVGAKPCMSPEAETAFFEAFTVAPSLIVMSRSDGAFAVLDPVHRVVVFTSGDL